MSRTIPYIPILITLILLIPTVSAVNITGLDTFNFGEDRDFIYAVTTDGLQQIDRSTLTLIKNRADLNATIGEQWSAMVFDDGSIWYVDNPSTDYLLDYDMIDQSITSLGETADLTTGFEYVPQDVYWIPKTNYPIYWSGLINTQYSSDPFNIGVVNNRYAQFRFDRTTGDIIYYSMDVSNDFNLYRYDSKFNLLDSLTGISTTSTSVSFEIEDERSPSDPNVDRVYIAPQRCATATIATIRDRCFTQVKVYDDEFAFLYNINLPSGYEGYDLEVWNAYGNNLVVSGLHDADSDGNHSAMFLLYDDDDGSFIGGKTTADAGTRAYIDVEEMPDGRIALAYFRDSLDDQIIFYDTSLNEETYQLDSDFPVDTTTADTVTESGRFLYSYDAERHSQYGFEMNNIDFDSIPVDVYRWYINTADTDEGITFDTILVPDRRVEVIIDGISLDYYTVPFIINDGTTADVSYSAEVYDPINLRTNVTSIINESQTYTINDPFSNISLGFDFYEAVATFNLYNRTTAPAASTAWLEFINPDSSVDLGDDVVFRIGVTRHFDDEDTLYDNNDSVYVIAEDARSAGETTILKEYSSGGEINNITLRMFIDRGSDESRTAVRLEVDREGARDTVASTIYLDTSFFYTSNPALVGVIENTVCDNALYDALTLFSAWPTCETLSIPNGTTYPTSLNFTLEGTNASSQLLWEFNAIEEPVFGSGSVSSYIGGAEELNAYILADGESTIRVYASHDSQFDNPTNYVEWTYDVELINDAVIVGVNPPDPFEAQDSTTTSTGSTDPTQSESASALPELGSLTQAQSNFVYTVIVLLLIWVIILGYTMYLGNLTGDRWVNSMGVVIATIASLLWIIGAAFIGWLPVWVIVLMIIIAGGIVVSVFRSVFIGGE